MGSSTSKWSREELEEAWARYQDVGRRGRQDVGLVKLRRRFTEDANYVEHALGDMAGREAIREWIVSTMNTFPGSEMPVYPVPWYSIDVDKGWIIFKNVNTMKDPGDGSVQGAPVITILQYAGNDKWSYEEDAYNPMNFMVMIQGYVTALPRTGHHLR